ncbi:uncharacterized protein MYCFIDRAFT_58758 [Pseudocercospora fijiensis CIRAD86]|uniref:Efflux pump dotC n=1 Tax=Pseudocercospora fijiensis (strain CIRAD86) TaxID=383855 RepID=M3ART1_PSEFD|nr:uncharacterized protein MYCFIDRAFT_58758 [Pseudocercospora fijiensis CIRAD86]EME79773.1 hypothetical protein MYCFIDRAFT_58758 [Pseudocercospora fijiensis CIRAD86]
MSSQPQHDWYTSSSTQQQWIPDGAQTDPVTPENEEITDQPTELHSTPNNNRTSARLSTQTDGDYRASDIWSANASTIAVPATANSEQSTDHVVIKEPERPSTTQHGKDEGAGTGADTIVDIEKQEPKEEEHKDEDGKINGRSKGKIAIIMLALCLAVFLAALDVTIITTALPTISEHFQSTAGYTWIGSAFLLANSASIPSWGKVSDIFGRKPMLLFANVVFMVGSLVAALSNSIGMLIAARAIQGVGGGGLIILVNIVIGDLFPLRIRGAFYGVIGAVWAVASSVGPIIGGAFTQAVSWRWCFYVNLPLDGLAFFILLIFLDIKTPKTPIIEGLKAIDWLGSMLVVGGTLMLLFGLQYGGVTSPWDSAEVLCLIIIGAFTLFLFGMWEWKGAKYPIMPLRLFAKVSNLATLSLVFLHGFVFISASYYLPLYFQAIRGATPILSGVYLLPTALALAVSSIGTGAFVAKVGKYLPPIYFAFFMMTLGIGLFIDFDAHSSWAKLIIYQIIGGLGVGPMFQAPLIALQAHISPRDIGTGTATLGFIRQLATSTSVVIGEVVYANQMEKKAGQLRAALGPQQAQFVTGGNAGASTQFIDQLGQPQKNIVREAFADSLMPMWIMYTCFSALGLIVMFFVRPKELTREHVETKTGIEAERANAEAAAMEREEKRASKRMSKASLAHPKRQSKLSFTSGKASHSQPDVPRSRPVSSEYSAGVAEDSKEKLSEEVPPVPQIPPNLERPRQ